MQNDSRLPTPPPPPLSRSHHFRPFFPVFPTYTFTRFLIHHLLTFSPVLLVRKLGTLLPTAPPLILPNHPDYLTSLTLEPRDKL